jgi:DNA-binding transcriptional ArsR family regulator
MDVELSATPIYPLDMNAERLPEPAADSLDLVTVLAALADRWRLAALRALEEAEEPAYCGQLMAEAGYNVGKSTVSHHMKVLREAGLTRTTVSGSRRYTTIRREELDARFPGLLDAVLNADADLPRFVRTDEAAEAVGAEPAGVLS